MSSAASVFIVSPRRKSGLPPSGIFRAKLSGFQRTQGIRRRQPPTGHRLMQHLICQPVGSRQRNGPIQNSPGKAGRLQLADLSCDIHGFHRLFFSIADQKKKSQAENR